MECPNRNIYHRLVFFYREHFIALKVYFCFDIHNYNFDLDFLE